MKTLRNTICAYAVVLLGSLGFTTASNAGSSDFAGIFVAVHGEVNGIQLDGTHRGGTSNDEITQGRTGAFVPVMGWEGGFNFPLGDVFFITMGAKGGPGGKTPIAEGDDYENVADFSVEISSYKEYYIQPSISVFDNSAIHIKLGRQYADLEAIGDITGQPNNLNGRTYAIGTTTMGSNGLFIRSEAGATTFEEISMVGVGGSSNATVNAQPIAAYGGISIGYKF